MPYFFSSLVLFWVDKAQPLGTAAANYMGYVYTNLSAPIYGELYADFGLLSLIIGMGVIGFFVKYVDNYYSTLSKSNKFGSGILLGSLLAGYIIILMRGSLLSVIPSVATLLGTITIAIRLTQPWNKKRQHLNT